MLKDFHEVPYSILNAKKLLQVKNAILHLNAEITEINSKTNKRCSKCEAAERKYTYCVQEIQRMRKVKEEREELSEFRTDIETFMVNVFPGINRNLLKDLIKKYYEKYKVHLLMLDLKEQLMLH